ncbi:retropepsin-like aspartic protease [Flavobacterium sp. CS20]|uniref:retropepsin-like aspartic protease n=1 Tax=Flavobacterium sp. CS20 TaxID=2775246 RepID=UPI001B39F359|nr:aspartyl protease family protein [Flavobacterium sp. CS20]QTY27382.1 aspartyl protease family protein [Flavobacterium sp. CS20]
MKIISLTLLIFVVSFSSLAQNYDGFIFHRPGKRKYKINFIDYNNLIIVKVKLNGIPMNFLLDTGVDKTVVFGLDDINNQIKNNSKKILIKGVSNAKTYAYKMKNNELEIGKLKDTNHTVYAIFDKSFNVSDKIGYQVQGIIGYEFFKTLIVKINYIKNHLKVYNPQFFSKSLNNYETLDLKLFKQKPYIRTSLQQYDIWREFTFLIDTGSGDAIWVHPKSDVKIPPLSFDDILGYGFADMIKGKRSKAQAFKLGSNLLKQPKIAYPDSLAYTGVSFAKNIGVLGSEILRRFHWIFDYNNLKIYFKPNHDIDKPFNYDMSGLILKYDGYQQIVQYQHVFSRAQVQHDNSTGYNKAQTVKSKLIIKKRPILKVGAVRLNSSAFEAGFIAGDQILKIEGRASYRYDLEEIFEILSSTEGREISFVIKRGGRTYTKSLTLRSRLKEVDD